MTYKEQLKKINEYTYELPKTGKMLVPGKIFASEILMNRIEEDCLKQIANIATLPGIQKYAIAMADIHVGYGFPIGGVAAFDLDKGVISPGGVGYDINCLDGEARILTELGYTKKIKEFEEESGNEGLTILDKKNICSDKSNIVLFMKKQASEIINVKTKSGIEISATGEHPVYTKNGMKEIERINIGEDILTYPFEGIEYEKPEKTILISEEDIDKLKRSETSKLQIKNKLKSLNLLPLYSDNKKIPYLLKIIGFVFGDGHLNLNTEQISMYGKKEDLNLIKKDLGAIGFSACEYSRKRKHHLRTQYSEYEFERTEESLHNNSSSLAFLLYLLGTPAGNKAEKDYNIPEWIMNSPKWYKRLFLASLFGAELSSPKTMTGHKFNFYGLIFTMSKRDSMHGLNFVNQISSILEEFGVKSVLIKSREDELNGTKSTRIRLMIHSSSENLIKFFSRINYEYNKKKRKLANASILWLKQKEKILFFREETMKKARKMKEEGIAKNKIIGDLSSNYTNKYFIDKVIYYQDYGRTGSRIAYCFPSFDEFVEMKCYGDDGFIWDEIESKEKCSYGDYVYDFTINNENHNFIANSLVVSNCSVRLLRTNLTKKDIEKKKKQVIEALFKAVPSGVGKGGAIKITKQDIKEILETGANWAVKNNYGTKEDLKHTEEEGCLKDAKSEFVSERAISRGLPQLGSLGAGNHFLEVQCVEEIFDKKIAEIFGLEKDKITIMIHCGSRGLGHQVASDYIKKMEDEYGWENLPDRELINAPIKSKLGKEYYQAMCAAANFAFCNKQMITQWVRETMKEIFPDFKAEVVYDICHNIAKFETHIIDGKQKEVLVCRKGATRSFGPGRKEIPEDYRSVGQPIILPGSMGTSSYVLVGTKKAEEISFGSTAHGAGRVASRHAAMKQRTGEQVKEELNEKGIEVKSGSWKSLAEEAPEAYKDIDEVVKASHEAGIGNLVAKVKPVAVMKG